MKYIIFAVIAIVAVGLTIYFTLKEKIRCPDCSSQDILPTGNKIYNEGKLNSLWGSPNSYHEYEYKCNKCGHTFFQPKDAVMFN